MKIYYVGDIKSIIQNLKELGVEVFFYWSGSIPTDLNGIVITDDLKQKDIRGLKERYNKPIIVSGIPKRIYRNIDILVLSEEEIDTYYKSEGITSLQSCKDRLKKLGIKYLVVSLGKDKIKKAIKYNLPHAQLSEIKITDKEVERAKDIITAVISYIYIKEGKLTATAIKNVNIGASLAVSDYTVSKDLTDYYLGIKLRR